MPRKLIEQQCEQCHITFSKTYRTRYCTPQCYYAHRSAEIQAITIKCDQCKKDIHVPDCKLVLFKRHFCSDECKKAYQRANKSDLFRPETYATLNCDHCTKEYTTKIKPERNPKHNYCSRECFLAARAVVNVVTNCKHCEKEIIVPAPQIANGRGIYCSIECQRDGRKKENVLAPRKIPKITKARTPVVYKSDSLRRNAEARMRDSSTPHTLYCSYTAKAEEKHLNFDISEAFFLELTKQDCYYCGIPPFRVVKSHTGKSDYVYTGVDRIDSSKGYEYGNVVPCCFECNRAKLKSSIDEFLTWAIKVDAFNPNSTRTLHQVAPYADDVMSMAASVYNRKSKAKSQRGIDFQLSMPEFIDLMRYQCSYCGDEPKQKMYRANKARFIAYSGLDRKNSAGDYTSDNVVPCCWDCNFAKSTMSVDEFYTWIHRLAAHIQVTPALFSLVSAPV
jgi:hypothetical protein